jgi:hypothetical protein
LPRLQKLIQKYKGRAEVQFVTMNLDDNPGLVGPFMKDKQLSFTVVPAYNYITDTLKVFGIPQNWIVNANGTVRLKGIGYDPGEKWEEGMAEAIEKNKP